MTSTLAVNEVFETFQGEAAFTGTPAVFLRLQGCDVGCPWCDTKHTWEVQPEAEVSGPDMLLKLADATTYARLSVPSILGLLLDTFTARHVVITGGEPCMYDLTDLTEALLGAGFMVQVETSGTEPIRVDPRTWVTVSPKIDMPGGRKVLGDAVARANEIKFPVGKRSDLDKLDRLLATAPSFPRLIWLQPLSQSMKATFVCMDAARDRGWRVSVQVHKFLGVR